MTLTELIEAVRARSPGAMELVREMRKKSHRVKLPMENERIAYWQSAPRKEGARALAEIAIMLWRHSDPQQDIEGFGKLVAGDLSLQQHAADEAA